jgi:hypothetical protein
VESKEDGAGVSDSRSSYMSSCLGVFGPSLNSNCHLLSAIGRRVSISGMFRRVLRLKIIFTVILFSDPNAGATSSYGSAVYPFLTNSRRRRPLEDPADA